MGILPLPDGALSLPVCGFHMMLQRRLHGDVLRTILLLQTPEESGEKIGQALHHMPL